LPLSVLSSSDLRTRITLPTSMEVGRPESVDVEVRNLGPHDAPNAKLTVSLPAGFGFAYSGGSGDPCSVEASTLTCQKALLPVGGSIAMSWPFSAASAGVATVSASATSSSVDVDAANSTASATINVKAPGSGGGSGSGGGGAMGLWALLAMLGWVSLTCLRRQTR